MTNAPWYEPVSGWGETPDEYPYREVADVSVDADDNVYLLTRSPGRVQVHSSDGTFMRAWGEGVLSADRTHGITIGPDGFVYIADEGNHVVRKFSPKGEFVMTIGHPGVPSETGYCRGAGMASITRGGAPFNRPTKVTISRDGDLYVTDGYGNARVHRFAPDGRLVRSWGEPGVGPGQFNLPHSIAILPDDRLVVADRENDRLQFFDLDGDYLQEWTHVQRPLGVQVDGDGLIHVSELAWQPAENSLMGPRTRVPGPRTFGEPSGIKVLDSAGNVMLQWRSVDAAAPGNVLAPHGICLDSHGDLYIAEVPFSYWRSRGEPRDSYHLLQKLVRAPRTGQRGEQEGGRS